ncbi:hypothetical protein CVS40_10952 [Lucilia cuprina]|nr:hypothetical protein CVS40_10952 [Lucilia cuprina]
MVKQIVEYEEYDDFDSFVKRQINQLPTNADKVAAETLKDDRMGKIFRILEGGKSLHAYGYKSPKINYRITSTSTSAATINILDELFASYGVPTTLVSNQCSWHPSTNGQAERSVQTVKSAIKAMGSNRNNLQKHFNIFLRQYRIAPYSTTGKPPALLFFGRMLRTRLDLLIPQDLTTRMTDKQYMQFNSTFRCFEPMQNVYFFVK